MSSRSGTPPPRSLHALAWVTAASAFVLIAIGGVVTSKGVGMAVPDWPTTYGYNPFFFPIDQWTGGIFQEHVHRLAASGVGLLTLVLAVWFQVREPRVWVRRLAWLAFAGVCVQGGLGGTRVLLNGVSVLGIPGSVFFGVLHATTAQLFLALVGSLTLVTSSLWARCTARPANVAAPAGGRAVLAVVGLMFLQLIVAATMRHQHAGLAIPDFPLAYGSIYPATDPDSLHRINQQRMGVVEDSPVTPFQIHLQMAHRVLAVTLVTAVFAVAWRLRRQGRPWSVWGGVWAGLLGAQFVLGAATVWTNKAADLATAHVAVGALSLVVGGTLGLALCGGPRPSLSAFRPCGDDRANLKTAAAMPVSAS